MKYLASLFTFLFLVTPLSAFAAPTIGSVFPTTAIAGAPVTLQASVSSGVPIQSCNLYVDLEDVGAMTVSGGTASKSFTFPFGGSRIAFVFCRDTGGGIASGPNTSMWVSGPLQNEAPLSGSESQGSETTEPEVPTSEEPETPAAPVQETSIARLVTLACPDGAAADHPCKAVYYVDAEAKRHAFPNEKVYRSWYQDFSLVEEVSAETMAGYQLGRNVSYRPGVRMVKFTTDPKVYAISSRGVLRWVATEAVATALYGADWNTKIDDMPDTFYTDYQFGADVTSIGDYSPAAETSEITSISENL